MRPHHFQPRYFVPSFAALGLALPFVFKPVHIDDTNFLALAEGARLDFWRPHSITINWQGTTQRAFEVLSNPPGIAWWLAPVLNAPQAIRHLWMLLWLPLLVWGAWQLGRRFAADGLGTCLLLLTSPIIVLSQQSLTPDLPLVALYLAGIAGFVMAMDKDRYGSAMAWAVLAGATCLFRYSGLVLLPLIPLYALLRRQPLWPAVGVLLPPLLLVVHDLAAYGQVHLLAMAAFQAVSLGWHDLFHKLAAGLAMIGGAGLLPFLAFSSRPARALGGVIGAIIGGLAVWVSGESLYEGIATVVFCTAACMLLAAATRPLLPKKLRRMFLSRGRNGTRLMARDDALFMAAWLWMGLFFLLALRFMAARYLAPFLAPLVIFWTSRRPNRALLYTTALLQGSLALAMAVDDYQQAAAQRDLARETVEQAHMLTYTSDQEYYFAGHWGWQYEMERAGWTPLEDGASLPVGAMLAVAETPWPQQPAQGTCLDPLWRQWAPDHFPGPRLHTAEGLANYHSYLVAGDPPQETYAPWTLADDPRERATLYRICPPGDGP